MKQQCNKTLWILVGALVLLGGVYFMAGGFGGGDEPSTKVPPPRDGSPDFGPLPSEFVIGGGDASVPKAGK